MVYFWGSHTATARGATIRRVDCFRCGEAYEYRVARVARGGGHAPLLIDSARAADSAESRAYVKLYKDLRDAVEPVTCPMCGAFQSDMVEELRRQHGKLIDPNRWANERIAISFRQAWETAERENTVAAYRHLIEVWPNAPKAVALAKGKIRDLRTPWIVNVGLRWFGMAAGLSLIAIWVVMALVMGGLVISTLINH